MKLMLRPEWRLWPLSSFLGIVDIKTGVIIALIFALLNKVAGFYGLIAMLTGAGGSFAQISLYVYSVFALVALAWGIYSVQNEDPKSTLYFAHIYFADHVFSTSWTIFFAVNWWLWTPHDGQRQSNSPAQQEMVKLANLTAVHLTPEEQEQAALSIWNHEKGKAAAIIILSWLFKIYFILLIYSYASHLRKGSYRSLPLTRSAYATQSTPHSANAYEALAANEDAEDFYRVPLQTPPLSGHRRGGSQHSVTGSVDFVSAPGRVPRKKGHSSLSMGSIGGVGGSRDRRIEEEDVLFDEDDAAYAGPSSSHGHSKLGNNGTAATSDEERAMGNARQFR